MFENYYLILFGLILSKDLLTDTHPTNNVHSGSFISYLNHVVSVCFNRTSFNSFIIPRLCFG